MKFIKGAAREECEKWDASHRQVNSVDDPTSSIVIKYISHTSIVSSLAHKGQGELDLSMGRVWVTLGVGWKEHSIRAVSEHLALDLTWMRKFLHFLRLAIVRITF